MSIVVKTENRKNFLVAESEKKTVPRKGGDTFTCGSEHGTVLEMTY